MTRPAVDAPPFSPQARRSSLLGAPLPPALRRVPKPMASSSLLGLPAAADVHTAPLLSCSAAPCSAPLPQVQPRLVMSGLWLAAPLESCGPWPAVRSGRRPAVLLGRRGPWEKTTGVGIPSATIV